MKDSHLGYYVTTTAYPQIATRRFHRFLYMMEQGWVVASIGRRMLISDFKDYKELSEAEAGLE